MYAKKRRVLPVILIVLLCAVLLGLGWYLFDSKVDRSGWVEKGGVYSYRDFHGKKITGWLDTDQGRYYFLEDKTMATHWLEIGGQRYYFSADGTLDHGWLQVEEKWYYADSTGVILTGWQDIDGRRYHMDSAGVMQTGWLEEDGKRYHLAEDGTLSLGLTEVEGKRYYFGGNGTMYVGAVTIDEDSYYFGDDGVMHTGWLETEESRVYYLPESGILASGWQEVDGTRYFFDPDGTLHTGWLEEGEYLYYLLEDGTAAVGELEIDGQLHYFTPKGIHVVLVNSTHKVPDYYEVNLVKVHEWHQVSDVCAEALLKMLTDCKEATGYYDFNSGYRSINDQIAILEMRIQENISDSINYAAARAIALRSVAVPGTSEHHLGLAVDILGANAIAWLTEHCWDYGFIVRYTAEKSHITGIINEPWHYRYVGTEVSLDMKDSGLCLEEYLGACPIETAEEATEETAPEGEPEDQTAIGQSDGCFSAG